MRRLDLAITAGPPGNVQNRPHTSLCVCVFCFDKTHGDNKKHRERCTRDWETQGVILRKIGIPTHQNRANSSDS